MHRENETSIEVVKNMLQKVSLLHSDLFILKLSTQLVLMLYDWFQNITFANPEAFSLLFIIPILALWYYGNNKKGRVLCLITTTHFLRDIRSCKNMVSAFSLCVALPCTCFLLLRLARPQQKFTEQQTEGEGIDIVFCFDISGSMTEKDFTPNRLEASKEVAQAFVNERTGDRIGVVIFSRQSFTLCPITTDKTYCTYLKSQI